VKKSTVPVILSAAKDLRILFSKQMPECFAEPALSQMQGFFAEFTVSPSLRSGRFEEERIGSE
jgi:hypothetical protein